MKGIVLAGGSGTRLYPLTIANSKQLMPIYDKPMIFYPLSTLMLAGIRDILIISTPEDTPRFEKLLGNGNKYGIRLQYAVQKRPEGLAQAFIIGEEFIGDEACAMVLGDNIFYGAGLTRHLMNSVFRAEVEGKATIYGYYVKDPERYGIVELGSNNEAISIEEKPKNPKSNYCVTGLYFYPKGVSKLAKTILPSERGELEITSLNNLYLNQKKVHVTTLGRGYSWLDTGTHDSLVDASYYIYMLESHQGLKIACLEEIAYMKGRITKDALINAGNSMSKNEYGQYLLRIANSNILYPSSKL